MGRRNLCSQIAAALAACLAAASVGSCGGGATAPSLGSGDLVVRVDTGAAGHAISPLIYGVSSAGPDVVRALGATVDRWGGNPSSTYNWVIGHAWNSGRDWQFRNANYSTRQGSASDSFISAALGAGARPLMTVPTLGWVAKNDDNATMGAGVPAAGGPPVAPGSTAIPGYDPTSNRKRTSIPSYATKPGPLQDPPDATAPAVYQDEWVHHLVDSFGAGGVQLFAMDNEPDLWSETHTDVHPVQMGYQDMLDNYREYAAAVKAQDPSAVLLGPDVSGWISYFYSALDRGDDKYATHADRNAHGGQPFLAWWLAKMRALDRAQGRRLVDYLDVHYYPQGAGVYGNEADPATRALRIRSTRSLWDPSYTDESWIGQAVDLIPRLKDWIAADYPGTKLAITEYSFGGEQDASGAVALAEALGAFGRLGVDLATYWTYPPPASPAGAAFRLFRDYDGRGATFGDTSLPVTSGESAVAAFAARHSDSGEVDVVLANESQTGTAHVHLEAGGGRAAGTPYCVAAGSSRIVTEAAVPAGASVAVGPLGLCTVRLEAA